MASQSVPSLHEIAAMPYSETLPAIRAHYDPAWGKNDDDGEPILAFRVQFDWTLSGRFDQVVEADTEEEARKTAVSWIHDDTYSAHLDIDGEKIEPAKAPKP